MKQDCIPVGCVPPACCPYLPSPSMHCAGGVPASSPGGCLTLVPGLGLPASGPRAGGSASGPGGVCIPACNGADPTL